MSIREPADAKRPLGGSSQWLEGPAGELLRAEFFGVAPQTGGAATLGVHAAGGYSGTDAGSTPARNTQATTGLLVFAQWETSSTPPTITDNKGNTFGAPFWTAAPNAGSLNNWLGAWFLPGATGGAGHVITATKANGYPSVWLVEAVGGTAITYAGQADTTSPYNSGNLTTSASRLLVGFVGEESTGAVSHAVNSAGFTALSALEDGAAAWTGITAARSAAPAGTYSIDVSTTGTGVADGAAIIVAVEGSGGGGGTEYPYTAEGGAVTGGAALLERTYSRAASGGLTSGGAATIARRVVRSYTATGGLVSGGAALLERNFQPVVGGDLATGGAALIERTYARAGSGGLTTGGTATVARRVVQAYTATGGAILGGAAAVTFQSSGFSFTASGGVILGGSALLERAYGWPASGGLTTGGSAALERTYARTATGGLVLGGAAGIATTVAPPAGGDLALGGAAGIARTFAGAAAGGLVIGGAAVTAYQQGSPSHVASGGVVVSGEGLAYRVYTYVAQPPELGTGPVEPGEPGEPQVIVQQTGGGYVEAFISSLVYVGGGRVRTGGAATASAMLRAPAAILRSESGPRLRLRGGANAYHLPRPRRNRDLEDLALANLARAAR